MDPWAPINGISLERYAELSADVSETQDAEKQVSIVAQEGVSRADWEAAKSGWTARMQDMSLMGQVATRYVALYQAALAKKSGGVPSVSFEDYVAMSGAAAALGYEGMLAHYKLTSPSWTMIAGHWNNQMPTNPQYMQYGILVENEAARIRSGGAPKPVSIGGPIPRAAPAQAGPYAAQPNQPAAYNPAAYQGGYPQAGQPSANPFGTPQQQGHFNAQMNDVGSQMANAFGAFGSAVGSFIDSAAGTFSAGTRVLVQWSDGNRYPGTVMTSQAGQVQVAFPDGRQMWIPQAYVSVAGF